MPCYRLLHCSCMHCPWHWVPGKPARLSPERWTGPKSRCLVTQLCVPVSLAQAKLLQGGKPHLVALCHNRTQPLSVLPFISPLYSQAFLWELPLRACVKELRAGLCQCHTFVFLCPCLLQRRAVRSSDRHLDIHRCHEHQETLRPGGNARWVMAFQLPGMLFLGVPFHVLLF